MYVCVHACMFVHIYSSLSLSLYASLSLSLSLYKCTPPPFLPLPSHFHSYPHNMSRGLRKYPKIAQTLGLHSHGLHKQEGADRDEYVRKFVSMDKDGSHTIEFHEMLQVKFTSRLTDCTSLLTEYATTQCNTLQRAATRCNTLQHTATYGNILKHALRLV